MVDIIDINTYNKASEAPSTYTEPELPTIDEESMDKMLKILEQPVEAQKHLASQIKISLDYRIKVELENKGSLSETTRKWVDTYTNLLNILQKSTFGDKHVNLNLNISHAQLAAKMREFARIDGT